jgi:3',5'-cyclic AMP phosphodiesterase CpdA
MKFKLYTDGSLYFTDPRVTETVAFAQVTDLHLPPDPPDLWPAECRHGIAWWDAEFKHPSRRLPGLLDDIGNRNVDFILFGGDVLDTYHPESAARVPRLCRERGLTGVYQFGNHDCEPPHVRYMPNPLTGEIRDDTVARLCEHWDMPGRYYAFERGNVRFVLLDSVYFKKDGMYAGYFDDVQVAWCEDQLRYDGPIIVCHHVPFHCPSVDYRLRLIGAGGGGGCIAADENGQRLRQAVETCPNVLGTFTGHTHLRSEDPLGNTWQLMTGAAANGCWRYVRIAATDPPTSLQVDGSPAIPQVDGG